MEETLLAIFKGCISAPSASTHIASQKADLGRAGWKQLLPSQLDEHSVGWETGKGFGKNQ